MISPSVSCADSSLVRGNLNGYSQTSVKPAPVHDRGRGRVYYLAFYAMKFSELCRNSNFVSYCSVGCSSIGSDLRPTTSPVSAST